MNLYRPAPELSAGAGVTHRAELAIFSPSDMYLFFVLQSPGCCGMYSQVDTIVHFSFVLVKEQAQRRRKGGTFLYNRL